MTAINSNRAIRGPVTAVPVVAGKGVRLVADTENNRWVVEADETVLYESDTAVAQGGTFNLSETTTNFDSIKIYIAHGVNSTWSQVLEFPGLADRYDIVLHATDNSTNLIFDRYYFSRSGVTITVGGRKRHQLSTSSCSSTDLNNPALVMKIVGVNRIASN